MINKKMGKAWILVVVVSALMATFAIPSISYASDAQSMRKLQQLKNRVEELGGACRNRARGQYLSEDNHYTMSVTLYSSNEYFIIAAGDSSVRDLDLELYDEDGDLVKRDNDRDATPIVKISPNSSSTYYIRVKMYRGSGYSNFIVCYQ